jgi:hypothetical protein
MPLDQIVPVALILLASSMVQGMVGFASGMIAIPSLLIVGRSLNEAVAISAVAAFAQNMLGVYSLRREIAFRQALRPILIRFAALPVGIVALKLSGHLDQHRVRQIVGVVVLLGLAMMARSPDRSRWRWPNLWDYGAFLSSGFLVGFCGIGGPPLVMWAVAQGWPPGRTRGFLFLVFFSSMFPQLLMLAAAYGEAIVAAMLIGVAGAPLVLAGTYLGLLIGRRFSRRWLRAVSFAILLAMALREIAGPFLD